MILEFTQKGLKGGQGADHRANTTYAQVEKEGQADIVEAKPQLTEGHTGLAIPRLGRWGSGSMYSRPAVSNDRATAA